MSENTYLLKIISDIRAQLDDLENKIVQSNRPDFSQLPGEEGVFDGIYMVTSNGSKYEVPANYAAKSKIVFGDTLKRMVEGENIIFKHVKKVPRKEYAAMFSKKEDLWYALTEVGTFKISDVAAEFNKIKVGDKGLVLLPSEQENVPFATLESEYKEKKNLDDDLI